MALQSSFFWPQKLSNLAMNFFLQNERKKQEDERHFLKFENIAISKEIL
jgi:hypothetical protein